MNSQYDSILKEKKIYVDEEKPKGKSLFKRCLLIDIVLIIIIIVVSYIIYYNQVLSTKNIVLDNSKNLLSEYLDFFKYLGMGDVLSDGTLEGELKLNDYAYKFNISKLNDVISINLDNTKDKVNYFYGENGVYYQMPSLGESYIKTINKNKYIGISSLVDSFEKILDNKRGGKTLYFSDNSPIIEVNTNLSHEDISSMMPNYFSDRYELIFTIKNDAIRNKILSEKLVINNQTKNIRNVYQYDNNGLTCMNNNSKLIKYNLNDKEKQLNIYHDDILYSIIKYTKEGDKNIYTYQVINEYYTLTFGITKANNHYVYEFNSRIGENNDQNDKFVIELDKGTSTNLDRIDSLINDNITNEDKAMYKDREQEIIKPILDFIDKYKESINNINNY